VQQHQRHGVGIAREHGGRVHGEVADRGRELRQRIGDWGLASVAFLSRTRGQIRRTGDGGRGRARASRSRSPVSPSRHLGLADVGGRDRAASHVCFAGRIRPDVLRGAGRRGRDVLRGASLQRRTGVGDAGLLALHRAGETTIAPALRLPLQMPHCRRRVDAPSPAITARRIADAVAVRSAVLRGPRSSVRVLAGAPAYHSAGHGRGRQHSRILGVRKGRRRQRGRHASPAGVASARAGEKVACGGRCHCLSLGDGSIDSRRARSPCFPAGALSLSLSLAVSLLRLSGAGTCVRK